MSTKSERDRLRLQLAKPTADPLYTLANPSVYMLERPHWPNADTGAFEGANKNDFVLSNRTARAIVALLQQSEDKERLAVDFVVLIAQDNEALIGAVILQLGLVNALSATPLMQSAFLAAGLTNALKHAPRTPTDGELAAYHDWAELREAVVAFEALDPKKVAHAMWQRDFQMLITTTEDLQRWRDRDVLLGQANPAIDRDRRELIGRLETLKIDNEIRSLLDRADKNADGGDFKGAMEKMRTFLERTYEACCMRYALPAGKNPQPTDSSRGSIGKWLDWADHVGLLTKTEHELVQKLYNFLSMEGSHAPTSEPRQYAVAKATVIEWCLLIADRVGR